jgi:hypothetical protein
LILIGAEKDTFNHKKARLLGLASQYADAKIGGCDPTIQFISTTKYRDINENKQPAILQRDPNGKLYTSPVYVHGRYVTNDKREERMGKVITLYSKSRTTSRPIVAIVGANHVQNDSVLLKTLDSYGISYKSIDQENASNRS